jgi:hypothetical protein
MAIARPQPLVLKPRQFQQTREQRWALAVVVILYLAVGVWLLNIVFANPFGDFDRAALEKFFHKLVERSREAPTSSLLDDLELPLVVVAGILHVWYLRRASKYERITLDGNGIRYQSPLPETLRALQPDWSLRWSQVRAARIAVPKGMYHRNLIALELDAAPKKRKVFVLRWVAADSAGTSALTEKGSWRDRFFAFSGSKRDVERTLREIEESPIVRYAREAGVGITTDSSRGIGSGFALESNRHALAGAVLGIALLCYALVDFAAYEERYAVDPPLVLFFLAGAIAALAGLLWFSLAKVPRAETLVLSLFLGAAAGFALYPGALRLNAATDPEGLHAYDYRLTSYVVFTPADSRLPVLNLPPRDVDYWGQFKLGTVHQFELRKGGLGFYQVDMGPVHAKMHEYFVGRN